MWVGYALGLLGRLNGDQPTGAVCKKRGDCGGGAFDHDIGGGRVWKRLGTDLVGWMSDRLGRINVLRTMIGIWIVAMPALYGAGGNVALLYVAVFVVYWCYGTQLSVNGAAASDFWGTKTRASTMESCSRRGVWRDHWATHRRGVV